MVLRELTDIEAFRLCEALQQRVWGEPVAEPTAPTYRAAVHAGALVVGAFSDDALMGFAYGFPSFVAGRVGLHSHLLAVLPEYRGRGVGQALKWFQRDWCLARGITEMTWTFDPLRAKNARLNLEHLGAHVVHYYPDFYGTLGGSLNGDLPSDRIVATWPLQAARVAALAAGEVRPAITRPEEVLLRVGAGGEPLLGEYSGSERLWLELPPSLDLQKDYAGVLRWRLALRQALVPLLASGYTAERFVAGGYVLART